jgi:hypothetical protein
MALLSWLISNLKRIPKLIVHHLSPDTSLSQISIQRKSQGFFYQSLALLFPYFYFTIFVK